MIDARFAVPLARGDVEVGAVWTGPARASADIGHPSAIAVIAPGAGAGFDHPFLVGLADTLAGIGLASLRFDFPYRAQGRRMPGPADHAIAGWRAAIAEAARRAPGAPLVALGKSYGGRMASMAAAAREIAPAGLVYLGYPLHPPGKPDALRTAHLPDIPAPQLFVSGRTDPFVDPPAELDRAVQACQDARLVWLDGNHSFEIRGARRPADRIGASIAPLVADWVRERIPVG